MSEEKKPRNTRENTLPDTYTPDPDKDGNVKEVRGQLRARHLILVYRKKLDQTLADVKDNETRMPPDHFKTYQERKAIEVYIWNCTIKELENLEKIRAKNRLNGKVKKP